MNRAPYVLLWARLVGRLNCHQARPVQRAYHLAVRAHDGQFRDGSGQPYIIHPLQVALILAEEMGHTDSCVLCVALLHDVIEDSDIPLAEVQRACGAQVTEAVRLLTKPLPTESKATRDEQYYQRLAAASPIARTVKCADRLDNLRSMRYLDDGERLLRYVEETRRYILPLAERADPFLYHALTELCEPSPSTI